jgi:hypothetical protein
MNKVTASEIAPLLMIDESKVAEILKELAQEGKLIAREDLIYFYKEQEVKHRLPLFFECRTLKELELIKKCFCADLPSTRTCLLLGLSDETINKFNLYFRKFIYNQQLTVLIEKYNRKPQTPRIRIFFDKPYYFYNYDNFIFVSERKLLPTLVEKPFNKEEVQEFKRIYCKIRRRIWHNKMQKYVATYIAETILREHLSFNELMVFLNI